MHDRLQRLIRSCVLICMKRVTQCVLLVLLGSEIQADAQVRSDVYHRLKSGLDKVRAIDTHDHLRAFTKIADRVETPEGHGFNLYSIWAHSYLTRTTDISPWPADGRFVDVRNRIGTIMYVLGLRDSKKKHIETLSLFG